MQNSKALAMLNLVNFRHKAESIKNTSYRKFLETYNYMLNDNLSICYIKTYNNISRYGYLEFREVDCSSKLVEISDIERDNSLFKIYKKEPIDGKLFDIHIQQISRPYYSLSQIKTKNLNLLYSMKLEEKVWQKDYRMTKEYKQSPNGFIEDSNYRQKSTINTNFDHCRYMLDSEMNICYISTIKNGSKNVLCTINIDKSKQNISVSSEKVVTDTPRKLVFEANYCGKQWFMQSFEDKMIDLILKKIYKLRGKIWKKM